jgi:TatD DNase family protein
VIDTHCHLSAPEFDRDREAVLARARAAGVRAIVAPAVSASEFEALAQIARDSVDVHVAFGLHPMFLAQHQPAHLDTLRVALRDGVLGVRAVAVGESGLDFFVAELDRAEQENYLHAQLRLARDFDLPIILHARRAHDAVALALRRFGVHKAVVHSFAGSEDQAQTLFRQGVCIGLGGPLTYPRAQRLRRIAASMPLEFLLLETDAPDQPLAGRQGQRNEPAQLVDIAACVADLRNCSIDAVIQGTSANAARLFQLPSDNLEHVHAA